MCNQDNSRDIVAFPDEYQWMSNKSSTNQDKIATVLKTYLDDWKNILPLFKL